MSRCRKCNVEFPAGTLFCESCGAFLGFDTPTEAAPPPSEPQPVEPLPAEPAARVAEPQPVEPAARVVEPPLASEVVAETTVAETTVVTQPPVPSPPGLSPVAPPLPQFSVAAWASEDNEPPSIPLPAFPSSPPLPPLPLPPTPLPPPPPQTGGLAVDDKPPPPRQPGPKRPRPTGAMPTATTAPPAAGPAALTPSALAAAAAAAAVTTPPLPQLTPGAVRAVKQNSEACLTALQAVSSVLAGAAHFDRPDLVARLRAAEARLQGSELAVVIVGEFKKGKSSLVNAISGFDVCPVDEVVATSVPTVLRYGPVPRATVTTRAADGSAEGAGSRELALTDLDAYISEQPEDPSAPIVEKVEIEVPSPLLATGVTLIDTPGVGGLDSAAAITAVTALRWAEAVLFVTDATQELTAPELEYLVQVREQCPNVTCVMTKVDLFGDWRRIVELDRQHLARHNLPVPILALSSVLERLGVRNEDRELQEESGFPTLRRYLDEMVIRPADQVAARAAARDVLFVLDQLAAQLRLEAEALTDPDHVGQLASQFEAARQAALALREQSARWQVTLGDGIQDLAAGVENDVSRRIRAVILAGEQVVDNNDPMQIWDEFEPWLRKRIVQVAVENDAYLRDRTAELVAKVVGHFTIPGLTALEPEDLARLALAELDRSAPTDQVMNDTRLEGLQQRGLTNLLAATRTGFSGTGIIAGLFHLAQVPVLAGAAATGVAGLAAGLVAVASIGIGRKVFGDMNRSEVSQRRGKAHVVFRRYVEEASFVLVKDARESLRLAQRTLRDQFTDFARELEQSAGAAVLAAEQARKGGDVDRSTRLPELQTQLQRILEVRAHVGGLAGLNA